MRPIFLLPLAFLFQASAQKVGVCSELGLACWSASTTLNFGCSEELATQGSSTTQVDPTLSYKCLCKSTAFLQTFANCVRCRTDEDEDIYGGFLFLYRQCFYNTGQSFSRGDFDDFYYDASTYIASNNYTEYLSDMTNTTNATTTRLVSALVLSQDELDVPVEISDELFDSKYKASSIAKTQYRLGSVYGTALLCYWAAIILGASIHRFIQQMYPEVIFANSRTVNYIRKYLFLPATFKRNRSRPVKLLLNLYVCAPTRSQSLVLTGYFILTAFFLCVNYNLYEDNPLTPGSGNQLLKYLGSRSGIIAFTQLPAVIIFAARNSPLIWLTGWPYDMFQTYHRWSARVMMINAVIHSACYMAIGILGGTWAFRWEHIINWRFGNLATYSGIIMVLAAINKFRSRWYEVFLVIHKVFFITFMIGIFRHCWDFGWMPWVYATLALYLAERAIRIFRTTVTGVVSNAYAEVYPDGVFRLSVQYSNRWAVAPGQYCYVRFLRKDLFWQAHPFSVYKSPDTIGDEHGNPVQHLSQNYLQFCIQAQRGATKQIADFLALQPTKSAVLPVMVQGPYGVPQNIHQYDTVFMFAGGLGITAIFSHAQHLQQQARLRRSRTTSFGGPTDNAYAATTQKVVILWVVRNTTPLEWFSQELASIVDDNDDGMFELQIYVTRSGSKSGASSAGSASGAAAPEPDTLPLAERMEAHDRAVYGESEGTLMPTFTETSVYDLHQNDHGSIRRMDSEMTLNIHNHQAGPSRKSGAFHTVTAASSTSSLGAGLQLPADHKKKRSNTSTILIDDYYFRNGGEDDDEEYQHHQNGIAPTTSTSTILPGLKNPLNSQYTSNYSYPTHLQSTNPYSSYLPYASASTVQHHSQSELSCPEQESEQPGSKESDTMLLTTLEQKFSRYLHYGRPNVKEEIARCLKDNSGKTRNPYLPNAVIKRIPSSTSALTPATTFAGSMRSASATFYDLEKNKSQKDGLNKTLAVISCGPPALVDNIRSSIVDHLMESEGRVEYFEEAFSW